MNWLLETLCVASGAMTAVSISLKEGKVACAPEDAQAVRYLLISIRYDLAVIDPVLFGAMPWSPEGALILMEPEERPLDCAVGASPLDEFPSQPAERLNSLNSSTFTAGGAQ